MEGACANETEIMWEPDPARKTKMDELRDIINQKYGVQLGKTKCCGLSGHLPFDWFANVVCY